MKPQVQFKLKVGDKVIHQEVKGIEGTIIDVGYLGQIETMNKDFNLDPSPERMEETFVDTEEEYFQPWYRIMWISTIENVFTPPTIITDSGKIYNGQECEAVLHLTN